MALPFIDPQDVVDMLGRGSPDDPGVIFAVEAACDAVRDITEQDFNVGTSTVVLDGTGTDALILPQKPVIAAGTAIVNGGTVTDYVLRDDGVMIRKLPDTGTTEWWQDALWWPAQPLLASYWATSPVRFPQLVWPQGRQNITVTYDHGYPDQDVPRSIRAVALAMATRIVVQGPVKQETLGRQVSVTYAGAAMDFTSGEQAILAKYRRYS